MGRWNSTVALVVGSVGAFALATAVSSQGTAPPAEAESTHRRQVQIDTQPHWTDEHLDALEAEGTPEQSLYLSAVQLIELERARGDVKRAIPALEKLAERASTQKLRNAIRRLLVDIAREQKDLKAVEAYLNRIIEETLLQQ